MRHGHHAGGGVDVVLVAGGGFAVFAERAVHHHRAEAGLDGAEADAGRRAVVLVHTDGDVRVGFQRGQNQVAQKRLAGVLARTGRALQNHG
jgi:hypothetical protein